VIVARAGAPSRSGEAIDTIPIVADAATPTQAVVVGAIGEMLWEALDRAGWVGEVVSIRTTVSCVSGSRRGLQLGRSGWCSSNRWPAACVASARKARRRRPPGHRYIDDDEFVSLATKRKLRVGRSDGCSVVRR
jgi:hypothetical protein